MSLFARRSRGILFVLSAPSGAGKSTVAQRAMDAISGFSRSVSTTTRPPRPGEIDGVDYHFVDRPTFERMIGQSAFLEWATVHGNYYGTSVETVRRAVEERGEDLLLVIDVQGAAAVRRAVGRVVTIFLVPPDLATLARRLAARGDEDAGTVALRLENAKGELARAREFDYLVVNDDLSLAVGEFVAIIMAERCRIDAMTLTLPDETTH
ncbi:MAG: guanylate kinase [Nitrospinae bacterium]|nr:guanylate kinase [Nitrospinota bacterium]